MSEKKKKAGTRDTKDAGNGNARKRNGGCRDIVVKSRRGPLGVTTTRYRSAKRAAKAVRSDERAYAVSVDGHETSRVRFLHEAKGTLPRMTPETEWEDCFGPAGERQAPARDGRSAVQGEEETETRREGT